MMMIWAETIAIEIDCKFQNYDGWFVPIGEENSKSCLVEHIPTISTWEVVTRANKNEFGNDKVKTINFSNSSLNFIPAGIEKEFRNLVGIVFDKCDILRLRQADFKPFPKIRGIWLRRNSHLEVLEKGLFDYNIKLEYINLFFNNFKHIDANLLDALNALTFINIPCMGIRLEGNSSTSTFKSLFESKCQNFEALQNHVDHILREDQHQRLTNKIPEVRKQVQTDLKPFKSDGRRDKLRLFNFEKLLANLTELLKHIKNLPFT